MVVLAQRRTLLRQQKTKVCNFLISLKLPEIKKLQKLYTLTILSQYILYKCKNLMGQLIQEAQMF